MQEIIQNHFILLGVLLSLSLRTLLIPSLSNFNDSGKYSLLYIACITRADENPGYGTSLREEKYLQSTLLVKNNGVLIEQKKGLAELINF